MEVGTKLCKRRCASGDAQAAMRKRRCTRASLYKHGGRNTFSKHFLTNGDLSIVVWNSQALFCSSKDAKLRTKIKYVYQLLDSNSVVMLQETHGSFDLIVLWFRLYFNSFYVHFSFLSEQVGGVITFIKKSLFINFKVLPSVTLQEGRVIKSEIVGPSFSVVLYNVHNYKLSKASFSIFKIMFYSDLERVNDSLGFLFFGWDFNVAAEGKNDIDHHFPLSVSIPRNNYGVDAKSINDMFSSLTEIFLDEPSHYSSGSGRLSFIDRAAFSCPVWAMDLFQVSAFFFC